MAGSPRVLKDGTKVLDIIEDKFVFDPSGCWLWTASCDSKGYAQMRLNGKTVRGHRAVYEVLYGPCPPGVGDHLCRVRHCVNPDHLEFVTNRENILRGTGFSARHAAKTHCSKGHPYDEENTHISPRGERRCRECNRIYLRERYWRDRRG